MASISFEGVTKRFRDGTVAVDDLWLDVPDGEFMILLGPSGCGKTTVLRMVAGFEEVSDGRIMLGDRPVDGLDPAQRDVAMVFQSYALFPHMTVRENMSFPLKMRRVGRDAARAGVADVAGLLGLSGMLDRMPHELSGGQRQRVAMGRAIVRHPQAFLMDEPLSNLDAKLRSQVRAELARLHRRLGVTTLYVTHDQSEAMTLGTRVAILRNGSLQQVGPPRELYRHPANVFVARFIGSPSMNLLAGTLSGGRLEIPNAVGGTNFDVSARWTATNRRVVVGIRPESCRHGSAPPDGQHVGFTGEVELVEEFGAQTVLYVAVSSSATDIALDEEGELAGTFAACVFERSELEPGDTIDLHVHLDGLHIFDAETGDAIVAPRGDERELALKAIR